MHIAVATAVGIIRGPIDNLAKCGAESKSTPVHKNNDYTYFIVCIS
jgi:hypothetical protein